MAIIIPFPVKRQSEEMLSQTGRRAEATVLLFPSAERTTLQQAEKAIPQKRKRGKTQEKDQRLSLYAKINIALRGNSRSGEPGLFAKLQYFDEEFYRDELDRRYNLKERFGRISAADLELNELEQVVKWLSALGWKGQKGKHRKAAPKALFQDSPGQRLQNRMEKIEAMLAEKGRVEGTDVPWGYAVSILKRQSNGEVKSFRDKNLTSKHLDGVIAALYRDAKRKRRRER